MVRSRQLCAKTGCRIYVCSDAAATFSRVYGWINPFYLNHFALFVTKKFCFDRIHILRVKEISQRNGWYKRKKMKKSSIRYLVC
jgi:hypothetical protein